MNELSNRKLTVCADSMAIMQAHARETYPDECCGMIVERNNLKVLVSLLQNTLKRFGYKGLGVVYG